jgi:hypothetical protein
MTKKHRQLLIRVFAIIAIIGLVFGGLLSAFLI